jgi:hypothetical protein
MIIKNKQKDYQGMSELYIFELEMKKHELELVEKQKPEIVCLHCGAVNFIEDVLS